MIEDPGRLSQRARDVLTDPGTEAFLSVVSVWEMVLKHSIGRLPLVDPPEAFIRTQRIAHGLESLPLDEESTLHLPRLPPMHKDPFDRMLICSSIVHGLARVNSRCSYHSIPGADPLVKNSPSDLINSSALLRWTTPGRKR